MHHYSTHIRAIKTSIRVCIFPCLKSYLAHQDAPVLHNVNVEWSAEGLLVMVDTGIKSLQDISVASTDSGFALLPPNQLQASLTLD
ncbi:MAG: hypothetical protein O2966_07275 [Proteobacteria bacterium]|nr:hypothetical protein [Pseudomonadota bacterium]